MAENAGKMSVKSLKDDVRADRASALREKVSGLSGLRVSIPDVPAPVATRAATPVADKNFDDKVALAPIMALAFSVIWSVLCLVYAYVQDAAIFAQPDRMGALAAGILAVPAFVCVVLLAFRQAGAQTRGRRVPLMAERKAEILAMKQSLDAMLETLKDAKAGVHSEIVQFETLGKNVNDNLIALTREMSAEAKSAETSAAQVAARMKEAMTNADSDGWEKRVGDLTGRLADLERMNTAFAERLDTISAGVGRADESLARSMQAFDARQTDLNAVADTIGKALGGVETLIARSATQASLIGNAGESISAALEKILPAAEKIEGALGTLTSGSGKIEVAAEKVAGHMAQVTDIFESRGGAFLKASENLSRKIEHSGTLIDGPVKELQAALNESDARHKAMSELMERRVAELNSGSEKALSNAQSIRDMLKGQVQELAGLTAQIAADGRALHNRIDETFTSAKTAMADTVARVEKAGTDVVEKGRAVTESVRESEAALCALENRIAGTAGRVAESTVQTKDNLDALTKALDGSADTLATRIIAAEHSFESMQTCVKATADAIDAQTGRASESVTVLNASLEDSRKAVEATAQESAEAIKATGVAFDDRLRILRKGGAEAHDILEQGRLSLEGAADAMNQAGEEGARRFASLVATLDDKTSDIHVIADQAILRIEAVQRVLASQFEEFSVSAEEAERRLARASEDFQSKTKACYEQGTQATQALEDAAQLASGYCETLSDLAGRTTDHALERAANVRREAQGFTEESSAVLAKIVALGQSLSESIGSIKTEIQTSVDAVRDCGREMRSQSAALAETTLKSSEHLSLASTRLADEMRAIETAADLAGQRADQVRSRVTEGAGLLAETTTTVLQSAQESCALFSKQADALFKSSQDVALQAEKIRDQSLQGERDSFFGAAKFLVESLHSLSVDLSRILDGESVNRTWQSYKRGDIGAFTRRLGEIGGTLPLERAQEKFAQDSEFRTFVQRYIRQFEELYGQAGRNDHGAMLSTVVASSDVAKLYTLLCRIAARDSRLTAERAKAA